MYPCVIRKLIFIHVLLHLALLTSAETAYYVSDTETTWEVARSKCSLATPDIIYSDTGITAAINLSGLGVENGEKLWLGYFMAYQLFEYIGCVKLATIQSISSANFTTISDPGQCYSACGNKRAIGMTFMTEATIGCFCLERPLMSTIDRENGCDKSCIKNVEGPACGGDRFVSVYKTVQGLAVTAVNTYPNANFKGNCVDYEPTQLYHWRTCSVSLKFICNTGTEAIISIPATSGSWLFSSMYCFRNQLYPVTNKIVQTIDRLKQQQPTYKTWTAMFRSFVIGKNNDAGTPLQHGYLEVDGDIGHVTFRNADTTTTYKSLCQHEPTQPTSTHTSPPTATQTSTNMEDTTSGKDTEDDTITTQQTTQPTSTSLKTTTQTSTNVAEITSENGTVTTPPTATHTSQKATTQTSTNEEGTSDKDKGNDNTTTQLYTYVGVAGGVILLAIIVIIVVVVVVRKRRKGPKASSLKGAPIKDVPKNPYSREDYVQVDYSQVTYEKGDNKPGGYVEVKTTFKPAEQTNSDKDDVYDTTNTSKPATAAAKSDNKYSSDNIYNRLNVAEDDTYSHTETSLKVLQKDGHKLSDNSPSGFTDNLYDRTDDIKDINDDTYSHLNQGLTQRNQNDDLYSKTGTFKSA